MAYCDINAEESGTLQNLDFLSSLQQKEGVVWARPYIRAGAKARACLRYQESPTQLKYLQSYEESLDNSRYIQVRHWDLEVACTNSMWPVLETNSCLSC